MTASARGKSSRGIDTVGGRKRSNKIVMANKAGRKSLYDTRIVPNLDYIRDAVAAGVEEKTIRDALEISETTWNDHKRHHEEFSSIFTCARARATIDKLVLASKALDKLAAGYDYQEKKQYYEKNPDCSR